MVEENKTPATPTAAPAAPAQGGNRGYQGGGNRGGFQGGNRGGPKRFNRNGPRRERPQREVVKEEWIPKTKLGIDVMAKKYASIDDVLLSGRKIMEEEIIEFLVPNLATEFINVGQAKGKFGGGKRKISKPTQKVTREGSQMSFGMIAVAGNKEGVIGLGFGKARETVPSREKSVRNAKKDLIMIRRGCGDWGCFCGASHSIPFTTEGISGSVTVRLMPAPKGTGLVVEAELKKMLELAGIKDVWSKTFGQTKNKMNMMKAGYEALRKLQNVKLMPSVTEGRGIKDGGMSNE